MCLKVVAQLQRVRAAETLRQDLALKTDRAVSIPAANKLCTIIHMFSPNNTPVFSLASEYELFAFISHMGTSTMCGHYVCHIKKGQQ